jgi:hypothetical protein
MVRSTFVTLLAVALLGAAACGNISRNGPYDAGYSEPLYIPDAAIDAAVPDAAVLHEAREFTSGSAHMSSATYTLDVQIGHAVQQTRATGPTYQFEPNAAIKP